MRVWNGASEWSRRAVNDQLSYTLKASLLELRTALDKLPYAQLSGRTVSDYWVGPSKLCRQQLYRQLRMLQRGSFLQRALRPAPPTFQFAFSRVFNLPSAFNNSCSTSGLSQPALPLAIWCSVPYPVFVCGLCLESCTRSRWKSLVLDNADSLTESKNLLLK